MVFRRAINLSWQQLVNAIERRKRIATLASFLATSASALTTDPATNVALGGAISAKIGYMRTILAARGGGKPLFEYVLTPSLKKYLMKDSLIRVNYQVVTPLLSPAQIKVQETNNQIIQNIFKEHTAHRYLQGCAQKMKRVGPNYLVPMVVASPKISVLGLIGYSCLGLGIGASCIYFSLNLLRDSKKKHSKMMFESNQVVIDVEAMSV